MRRKFWVICLCIFTIGASKLSAQPSIEYLSNQGLAKFRSGDYAGAASNYDKAIELAPGIPDLYYDRGIAKDNLKDFSGAVSDYSKAIQLDPTRASFYNNRGNAKADLDDIAGAVADYDKAIELDPTNVRSYQNRGGAKRALKDFAGAMLDYKKALELDPKHATAYSGIGYIYSDKFEWQKALENFRKVEELDPTGEYLPFAIWVAEAHLGEQNALNHLAEKVKSIPAARARIWPTYIGRFLIGDLSESELFQRAKTSAPNPREEKGQSCEAYYYAGMKRLLSGDKEGATALFHKCLDTGRRDYDEYGRAEAELGALQK